MALPEEKANPEVKVWPKDAVITLPADVWGRILPAAVMMAQSVGASMYENAYPAAMVDLIALRTGEKAPTKVEVLAINGVSVLRWTRLYHPGDLMAKFEQTNPPEPGSLLGRTILSVDSLQRMIQAVKDVRKRFGKLLCLETMTLTLDMPAMEFRSGLGAVKLWEETKFGYPRIQDGKFPVNALAVAVKSHGDLPPCSTPIGFTGRFIVEAVQILHLVMGGDLKKSKKGVIVHAGQTPTSAVKLTPNGDHPFEDETVVVYMMPMRV